MKTPMCIICKRKKQVEWNMCAACLKTVSDEQRAKAELERYQAGCYQSYWT